MRKYPKKNQFLLTLLLGLGLLAGCTVASVSIPTATVVPEPTPTIQPTATSIPPANSATLPILKCTDSGVVKYFEIQSDALKGKLAFNVYFPPCYGNGQQTSYPVIYLLHGQTYDETQWVRLGAPHSADQLIQEGHTQPFLMIMPLEEFYFRPVENNEFPQALIKDLLPWSEKNLNACNQASCRAIGGISRGASWALHLALQSPYLFGSVGGHSLPTFIEDMQTLPVQLKKLPHDLALRLYLDIGRSDPEVKSAYNYEQILNQQGVLHEWHLNEGHHDEEYWSAHISEYLGWYAQNWKK